MLSSCSNGVKRQGALVEDTLIVSNNIVSSSSQKAGKYIVIQDSTVESNTTFSINKIESGNDHFFQLILKKKDEIVIDTTLTKAVF